MDLAQRVAAERRARGDLSIREASDLSSTSNETWSKFERTGHVTRAVRRAVSEVFGWKEDWPENPPPLPPPEAADALSQLHAAVCDLVSVAARQQQVEDLHDSIEAIAEQLRAQGATIERLAGLLDRQMRPPRQAAN